MYLVLSWWRHLKWCRKCDLTEGSTSLEAGVRSKNPFTASSSFSPLLACSYRHHASCLLSFLSQWQTLIPLEHKGILCPVNWLFYHSHHKQMSDTPSRIPPTDRTSSFMLIKPIYLCQMPFPSSHISSQEDYASATNDAYAFQLHSSLLHTPDSFSIQKQQSCSISFSHPLD